MSRCNFMAILLSSVAFIANSALAHEPRETAKSTQATVPLYDNLVFDVLGVAGVGIVEQEGAPPSLSALPAAVALLAFKRRTMPDNIGPLAVGAVQHLGDHRIPPSSGYSLA